MSGGSDRRPLVIGNWKMNLTEGWAVALVDALVERVGAARADIAVAPAFPCLRAVANRLAGSGIGLAAQDVHWEEMGPYTGEVSARMLAEMGVRWVLVGHSERRALFGDTDERVGQKAAAVSRHAMIPVVCVGEQESDRVEGRTLETVERQLRRGLAAIAARDGHEVVIAYEPVWAIGTGRVATPSQVREVHRMIREQLGSLYGPGPASAIRIVYGGSVSPENAAELLPLDEVDGALVGGASLDADRFAAIIARAASAG